MLHQFALGVYLRQNLLQFLFTPNYAENRPEAMFRDLTDPNTPVINENDVFLYNRPQQSGGKGRFCLTIWSSELSLGFFFSHFLLLFLVKLIV